MKLPKTERTKFAYVLAGNEPRFLREAEVFQQYLLEEAGFLPERVALSLGAYRESKDILLEIDGMVSEAKKHSNPALVVFYYGHGEQGALSPNGGNVNYSDLAHCLDQNLETIFINNSCHSGSAIASFKEARGFAKWMGVIASTKPEKEADGYEQFLKDVLDCYRDGKPYLKKVIRRDPILEKHVLDFRDDFNPIEEVAQEEEIDIITYNVDETWFKDPKVKIYTFNPPRKGKVIDRPMRAGRQLDYLLYAQSSSRSKPA